MIIYYNQADPRWGKVIYSAKAPHTETIAESGCGPTSTAMVISSLCGVEVLPPQVAKYSVDNGFRVDGVGTAFGLFGSIANEYVMKCTQTGFVDKAIECVNAGGMVVCSTNGGQNGLFSSGGHIFVMATSDGNNISFLDPGDYQGKYDKSFRKPYVKRDGNYVIVKKDVADKHIFTYFLFTKIEVKEVPPTMITDIDKAIAVVQGKTGFSDRTMQFLQDYKYGDEMLLKLANLLAD